jgi:transcriptional regulator with XRE-family HTH domain
MVRATRDSESVAKMAGKEKKSMAIRPGDAITANPALFSRTQDALAGNLSRALRAAVRNDNQDIGVPVQQFAKTTGISRSSITKFMAGAAKPSANGEGIAGRESNPDLLTICRMAAELGISPAFLLLSPSDWKLLVATIGGCGLSDAKKAIKESKSPFPASPAEQGTMALRVAERIYGRNDIQWKVGNDADQIDNRRSIDFDAGQPLPVYTRRAYLVSYEEKKRMRTKSVRVNAALPPYSEIMHSMNKEIAFAFSVLFGYNFDNSPSEGVKEQS